MLRQRIALFLLLSLLMAAGCSTDQEATLVQPENTEAQGSLYADLAAVLQSHNVPLPENSSPDKYVPLPTLDLFDTTLADAVNAVQSGTWWPELTTFVKGNKGYLGYEVSWLVNIPGEDPNAYYCTYVLDTPVDDPTRPREIEPYVDPLEDTIVRVRDIIENNPTLAINRTYQPAEDFWMFAYGFDYPVGDAYYHFEMFQIRLMIME